MAQLFTIGIFENEAEKWAAEFLRDHLPDHYRIYTNLYLIYEDQIFEIDQLIVTDYVIHLVDVKGLKGKIRVGQGRWYINDRPWKDPLNKILKHCRRIPKAWQEYFRVEDAPWFQGSVFCVGFQGKKFTLSKSGMNLPVYTPDDMPEYIESATRESRKTQITPAVIKQLESFLSIISHNKGEEAEIGDFSVLQKKEKNHLESLWLATSRLSSITEQYNLKVLHLSRVRNKTEEEQYIQEQDIEFQTLESIKGIPGVPRALPPFYDESTNNRVLPILEISGQPVSILLSQESFGFEQRTDVFLQLMKTMERCHQREVYHGFLDWKKILIRENNRITVCGFGIIDREYQWRRKNNPRSSDIKDQARDCFQLGVMGSLLFSKIPAEPDRLQEIIDNPLALEFPAELDNRFSGLGEWIRDCLNLVPNERPPVKEWMHAYRYGSFPDRESYSPVNVPGRIINDTYKLKKCLSRNSSGEAWEATHIFGEFICCLKMLNIDKSSLEIARREFKTLIHLFHPNIIRIFTFERDQHTSQYFLVTEKAENTLRHVMFKTVSNAPEKICSWFADCLSALEYLRKQNILHRDIRPATIMINGHKATLFDFNASYVNNLNTGTARYRSPWVTETGTYDSISDLYSLCLSFYELITRQYPFENGIPYYNPQLVSICPIPFPEELWQKILKVLMGDFPEDIANLKSWFFENEGALTESGSIPGAIREKWNIDKGIEAWVVLRIYRSGGALALRTMVRKMLKQQGLGGESKARDAQYDVLREMRKKGILDYPGAKSKEQLVQLDSELIKNLKALIT
jgi:serine/threonine protein kinase